MTHPYVINVTERNWSMWGLKPHEIDQQGDATALARRPVEWWMNSGNVAALLRWLYERGEIAMEIDEVSYFVSKPWKWTDSWRQMQDSK